jgi:hypothetical protein
MKVGREKRYKIGKANIVEQRTRQVAVSLPEDLELIHAISTDDALRHRGILAQAICIQAARRRVVRVGRG